MADLDRLKALASQQGPASGDNAPNPQQQKEALEAREAEEEARRGMLSQILLPEARERLARIQLVRPQRAQQVQDIMLRMAQSGQLRGRVTEDQLIGVLDQVEAMETRSASKAEASKITFSRRKGDFSDDDDDAFILPSGSTGLRKTVDDDDDDFDL